MTKLRMILIGTHLVEYDSRLSNNARGKGAPVTSRRGFISRMLIRQRKIMERARKVKRI